MCTWYRGPVECMSNASIALCTVQRQNQNLCTPTLLIQCLQQCIAGRIAHPALSDTKWQLTWCTAAHGAHRTVCRRRPSLYHNSAPGCIASCQTSTTEPTARSGGACSTIVHDPVMHSAQPSMPKRFNRSFSSKCARMALQAVHGH